tara:strand:+ start:469 stop:1275 length:807 start_codon:yes stop_codon:yes gene_type:complete
VYSKFSDFIFAVTSKENFVAIVIAFLRIKSFPQILLNIIFNKNYTWKNKIIKIKYKRKIINIKIRTKHDIATILGVFCRLDYKVPEYSEKFLDIGSNIGISLIYFLKRSSKGYCFAVEPNPENIIYLKENLKINNLDERVKIHEGVLLSPNELTENSKFKEFYIEQTGKFGSIKSSNKKEDRKIIVKTFDINLLINDLFKSNNSFNVIKVDTEGNEDNIIRSINQDNWNKINFLYSENSNTENYLPRTHQRFFRYNVELIKKINTSNL